MRRKDREITSFIRMFEIMKECDCCRLGLVDDGEAYIVPMNFGFDVSGDRIALYFHCANEGRRMRLLPKQSSVTFEMDTKHRLITGEIGCDYSYLYQSIMGKGSVTQVSDPSGKIYALQKIMEHYTNQTRWTFDAKHLQNVAILKLSVDSWSCKEH